MVNYMKMFVQRILKDLKQKELMPVKILFFVHMSTILVLYPYLTIHMRELGINIEETAIMSAVTPVVGILMPPLAGMLADKIGNFKVLLALFSVFSGLSALLLLLIPIGRITITYPSDVLVGLSCNVNRPLTVSFAQEFPCQIANNHSFDATLDLQACGYVCQAILSDNDTSAVFRTNQYEVLMHDLVANSSSAYQYRIDTSGFTKPRRFSDIKNHETLKLNDKFTTSIRRFSKNSFFFPTPLLYNFSCAHGNYRNTDGYACAFSAGGLNNSVLSRSFPVELRLNELDSTDVLESRLLYSVANVRRGGVNAPATCSDGFARSGEHVAVHIPLYTDRFRNETYKRLDLGSCAPRCIATAKRIEFCTNPKVVRELDMSVTFWSYLAVRVFIGIIGGTAYTMFEGAVIAILREYKADYGLQRMYASFGGMISSPLSGMLIDMASSGKGYTDFRPIFFLYAGLKVTSAALMLFINLEFKSPSTSVVADVMAVLNVELVSLFVASFLLGSAWGYIENYLFWLLEDLGGTKSLMGLTITVGGILGIPLLALSGPIIKRLGHANVIFIGFLTYAVRLFGYSQIYNPWFSLFFEALECLTHSLCFTAAVTYAARLSSVTTDTTIQGILGGLFYGVGKSAGSLVGGYLITYFGMRGTFQIFAGITAITAFVYLAFYHFYMKKRSSLDKEIDEKPDCITDKSNGINMKITEKQNTDVETHTNIGYSETEKDDSKMDNASTADKTK